MQDDLLYKKNYAGDGIRLPLVVPAKMRPDVLCATHDDGTAGHMGFAKTYRRLQGRFYWPRMRKTIEKCVSTCEKCQKFKRPNTAPMGLLHPLAIPSTPFKMV